MHKRDWVQLAYCHRHASQLVDGDNIKANKIIRGSLDAAFELAKVIKCSMFLNQTKKIKYSPKREGASSRLRKENVAGNFGDTISCPNCWTVREALSQSILNNWAVSQGLRNAILKGRVYSRGRSQVIDVQTQMQSLDFFFVIQLRVLVLRHTHNSSSTLQYIHVHVILKIQ